MNRILIVAAFLALTPGFVIAELALPSFFSDHMVLQRGRSAAIWGTATPNSEVAVTLNEQTATTRADEDGNWRVELKTGAANSKGATLTIKNNDDEVMIGDVLIGEVWLASGQSNMAFTMRGTVGYDDIIKQSDYPEIRMFNAATVTATQPQSDIPGQWSVCTPENVPGYSAVAFFFARKLHQELGVPVGVIKSAWGGKPVETFTSRAALNSMPETKTLVDAALNADRNYDAAKAEADYKKRLRRWENAIAEHRSKPASTRGRAPRKPSAPKRPLNTEGKPGVLFDSMIHPFVGYSIQGAIWYQGEANAKTGHVPYNKTLPLMIQDWRARWDDDFSFYFVQLANFRAPSTQPGTPDPWALLQDRMRRVLDSTPKTGMAIINDVGAANDIHPKNKKDPGERLARWALAKDYGRDITYCGPLFHSSTVKDGAVEVTFDQAGAGLKSRDDKPLQRFEIAGKDRVWHWADAEIVGEQSVNVSSEEVPHPVAVRYAWASNPEGANLVNSEGLPASVFRSDDWDDVEAKAK